MAQAFAFEVSTNNLNGNGVNLNDSDVVRSLQVQVANAFALYLNYKHYYWQTFGPISEDVHLLFDELAVETLETVDVLAERVRMIGQNPVAHIEEFTRIATVKPAQKDNDMRGMIEEAGKNLLTVIREMREAIKTADKNNDPGTADVFTKFVQIHEKYEWWLRDMLDEKEVLIG